MESDAEIDIATVADKSRAGSIIAAAGCGKTEQIALAVKQASQRRLVLTHTHAGVDVLRNRMKELGVPATNYKIDTIAGWCLRYAASYPKRAGLKVGSPRTNEEWNSVYKGAAAVINAGSVDGVLRTSYGGVYVDEYQDCAPKQHEVVLALSSHLPVCVFGDPLQAIFDFKEQVPVNFERDVLPRFPVVGELKKAWRWHKADNKDLADWLQQVRIDIELKNEIDLSSAPSCVKVEMLPDDAKARRKVIASAIKSSLAEDEKLVVIGESANQGSRVNLAKQLARLGFSNIEPVGCPAMYAFAKKLDKASNEQRFKVVNDLLSGCMTGVGAAQFSKAVTSCLEGKRLGRAKYGDLIDLGAEIMKGDTNEMILFELLTGFMNLKETNTYRREMLYAIRSALNLKNQRTNISLTDAIAEVQSKIRHAGRRVARRSIGSTLLVKGLEFERSVIVGAPEMSKKDWYVALTRATMGMTILSPTKRIVFKTKKQNAKNTQLSFGF